MSKYFIISTGYINNLLSMKIWEPLVRLCYLAYLVHPIVMYTFNMNMQQTIMVNHWIMVVSSDVFPYEVSSHGSYSLKMSLPVMW